MPQWLIDYGPWVLLGLYVFFSALGHVKMTAEQARRWPRLFSAILFGQAIGIWVARAIYPLLGMFAPQKALALVDKVFPPPPPASTLPDPAAAAPTLPAASPTPPSPAPGPLLTDADLAPATLAPPPPPANDSGAK